MLLHQDNLSEKPVNCIGCGKKIAEGSIEVGLISLPCPRCKVINVIGARHKPEGLRPREFLVVARDMGTTSTRTR